MRRVAYLSLAIVAVALVVAAGCGNSAGASPAASSPGTAPGTGSGSGGTDVTIQNFSFTPQTITVKPGTKVTWTNKDSVPHNIVSTDGPSLTAGPTPTFNSGTLSQGQTFSFTFAKAGTYFYECSIHANIAAMHATIVVKK
jgi:plastocyanin